MARRLTGEAAGRTEDGSQSVSQSVSQSQSVCQSVSQSVSQSVGQSVGRSASQPVSQSASQPVGKGRTEDERSAEGIVFVVVRVRRCCWCTAADIRAALGMFGGGRHHATVDEPTRDACEVVVIADGRGGEGLP